MDLWTSPVALFLSLFFEFDKVLLLLFFDLDVWGFEIVWSFPTD